MILTNTSLRNMKTALMAIPGHPGSSRLTEALARGFRFPDYHAMKSTLDNEASDLAWEPDPITFEPHYMIDFLKGTDGQIARDLAMTTLWLHEGGDLIYESEGFPELAGGQVILLPQADASWRSKAAIYLPKALGEVGSGPWYYTPPDDHWYGLGDIPEVDYRHAVRIHDADHDTPRVMTDEEFFGPQGFDLMTEDAGILTIVDGLAFNIFLEVTFLRFCSVIPRELRKWHRHLCVDQEGIRFMLSPPEYQDVRICIWILRI